MSPGLFRMFIKNAKLFLQKDIIWIYPSALTWIQWDPKTLLDTIRRDHFSLGWLQNKLNLNDFVLQVYVVPEQMSFSEIICECD